MHLIQRQAQWTESCVNSSQSSGKSPDAKYVAPTAIVERPLKEVNGGDSGEVEKEAGSTPAIPTLKTPELWGSGVFLLASCYASSF